MRHIKKISLVVIAALILIGSFTSFIPTVLAATGGGTATIGVDGGAQSAGVTVVQSTSHIFTVVLTIPLGGMTLGASSPTFAIPTGFTAPNTHAVALVGDVDTNGEWSVVASGGGCAVDSAPSSSTSVASGQTITVDITADCAVGNTITLTYQGTSAITMGATALTISTANAGDTSPVTPLIAGSPTITVTAAAPTPTPTPTLTPAVTATPASASSLNLASSNSSSTGGETLCIAPEITTVPTITQSRQVSPTSIAISWGPFAGLDTFNIQYGLTKGAWLYNTNVTGFSTTINDLPPNQPIWFQVAARNSCRIGTYGEAKLLGGAGQFAGSTDPLLPDTGFRPH